MGTIRFEIRKEKKDKNGKAPIRLIYQVEGQRKYYNTDLKVFSECWNKDGQQFIYLDKKAAKKLLPEVNYDLFPSDKDIKKFNQNLSSLQNSISDIEKRFELDKIGYSAEMVITKLRESKLPLTLKQTPSKVLYDLIDRYIAEHSANRERGSLAVYRSTKTRLKDYERYIKKQITFESINSHFFQSFQNFLISGAGTTTNRKGEIISRKPLHNTTIAKQLSTLKTFLKYAKSHGIKFSDQYKDFTIKRESLGVIALTNDEFETLFNLDLSSNKRLSQVRDTFCFACCTGLRYSDMNNLKRENIKKDELTITVKKTKEILAIPLNRFSLAILQRYKNNHRPLPIISNQKMNKFLKGWDDEKTNVHHPGLCEIAGINEPVEVVRFRGSRREATTYPKYELVGVHTGRKTFASLSLEKGMSAEEVMEIGGWKDYASFKRYVKITEQRKKIVMRKAWDEPITKLKAV